MKGELLYGLLDGLKGFLNKTKCDSLKFICKAIQKCEKYCLQQLADSIIVVNLNILVDISED